MLDAAAGMGNDGADPLGIPLLLRTEVPRLGVAAQQEAARGGNDDGQSDKAADQRRKLSSQEPGGRQVRADHRPSGEQCEWPDRKPVAKRAVGTEESASSAPAMMSGISMPMQA